MIKDIERLKKINKTIDSESSMDNHYLISNNDVRFLLSLVEKQREALSEFACDSNWDYDEYRIPRWNGAGDSHPKYVAKEALKEE